MAQVIQMGDVDRASQRADPERAMRHLAGVKLTERV
jgi:hypothetical protein